MDSEQSDRSADGETPVEPDLLDSPRSGSPFDRGRLGATFEWRRPRFRASQENDVEVEGEVEAEPAAPAVRLTSSPTPDLPPPEPETTAEISGERADAEPVAQIDSDPSTGLTVEAAMPGRPIVATPLEQVPAASSPTWAVDLGRSDEPTVDNVEQLGVGEALDPVEELVVAPEPVEVTEISQVEPSVVAIPDEVGPDEVEPVLSSVSDEEVTDEVARLDVVESSEPPVGVTEIGEVERPVVATADDAEPEEVEPALVGGVPDEVEPPVLAAVDDGGVEDVEPGLLGGLANDTDDMDDEPAEADNLEDPENVENVEDPEILEVADIEALVVDLAMDPLLADGPAPAPASEIDRRDEHETELPTLEDLRSMAADLDEVDAILERLDDDPEGLADELNLDRSDGPAAAITAGDR